MSSRRKFGIGGMIVLMAAATLLLVGLYALNPWVKQIVDTGLRTPTMVAYSAIAQPEAVHALLKGEPEAVPPEADLYADLWSADRFSEWKSTDRYARFWMRKNYGLLHIDSSSRGKQLELSPNGSHTCWEMFGNLTAQSQQLVVAEKPQTIEQLLDGGKSCWGTLSVVVEGKPDSGRIVAVSFTPESPPESIAITPDE